MRFGKPWSSSVLHLNDQKAGVQTKQRKKQDLTSTQWQNQDLNNVFLKTLGLSQKDCGTFESLLKTSVVFSGFPKISIQLNNDL